MREIVFFKSGKVVHVLGQCNCTRGLASKPYIEHHAGTYWTSVLLLLSLVGGWRGAVVGWGLFDRVAVVVAIVGRSTSNIRVGRGRRAAVKTGVSCRGLSARLV